MLLVSSTGRQTPAHQPRDGEENIRNAAGDVVDEVEVTEVTQITVEAIEFEIEAETVEDTEDAEDAEDADVMDADEQSDAPVGTIGPDTLGTSDAKSGRADTRGPTPMPIPPASGQRGPAPYAPGMRTHMSPLANADPTGGEPAPRTLHGPPGRSIRLERERSGDRDPIRPEVRGEVGPLIDSLHDLFAQDRTVASQGGTTRCGICYLHFPLAELEYREEEGYYVCSRCARSLGHTPLPMVRRQQRS